MDATPMTTVLDGDWDPGAWWSTTNHGEAVPGVLTPMNWAFWGVTGELATRRAFVQMGVLEEELAGYPAEPHERVLGIFHGRVAGNVSFIGAMGDRIPGMTGAIMAESLIGRLPSDFPSDPTDARYSIVAERMPRLFAEMYDTVTRLGAETDAWWRQTINRVADLDIDAARRLWFDARERFAHTVETQIVSIFAGVQPAIHRLTTAATEAGRPELMGPLLSGQGSHAELTVVVDLWRLSRDEIRLEDFLTAHGYHGPMEGEMSSRVWREDPTPILNVAAQYRAQPDERHPLVLERVHEAARRDAQRELMDALKGEGRTQIEEADRYVPLRGVGKVAFLQNLDVARAAARRIGALLAGSGAIDDPEDVFYLVEAELRDVQADAPDLKRRVAERRAERERCAELMLPTAWRGRPEVSAGGPAGRAERTGLRLDGVAASAGLVEGVVRVVTDPTFADVEPGEILVAPLTDPAWAPIMYCSAGLIVDTGGMLSHAAVVARELGLPCVMGVDATRQLRTGDRVRVDGTRGVVELLDEQPPSRGVRSA
jgi:pyruvate,water dikinase